MQDTPLSVTAAGRDWLGAETLRWQTRFRLAGALAGAAAAVVGALVGGFGVRWAEAAVAASLAAAYCVTVLLCTRRAVRRHHAGVRLRTVVALGDVALVFALTVALAGVQHLERALVLTTFSVLVTQLFLGTRAARAAFWAGALAYAALLAWSGVRVPGVDVWSGLVDLTLFGLGGLVVAGVHASRQRRLRDLVGLFGRLEEGDFGHAYDWTRDPRPDAVSAVGRAYDRMRTQVATAVLTDPLSGCVNRRGFDQEFTRALARAERAAAPVALLALDIDHFKRVNDTHGHLVGDDVLRGVATVLRTQLRDGKDLLCRFGGEEFAAFLPGVDDLEAPRAAERLRRGVAELVTPVEGGLVQVTCSVGAIVTDRHSAPTAEIPELLAGADLCLYQAKADGRDQVRLLSRPDRRARP